MFTGLFRDIGQADLTAHYYHKGNAPPLLPLPSCAGTGSHCLLYAVYSNLRSLCEPIQFTGTAEIIHGLFAKLVFCCFAELIWSTERSNPRSSSRSSPREVASPHMQEEGRGQRAECKGPGKAPLQASNSISSWDQLSVKLQLHSTPNPINHLQFITYNEPISSLSIGSLSTFSSTGAFFFPQDLAQTCFSENAGSAVLYMSSEHCRPVAPAPTGILAKQAQIHTSSHPDGP